MRMGDAVLADRPQEKADQLSVSSLGDHEQGSTVGCRFQDGRWVALHDPTVDGEIRCSARSVLDQMVEHLPGARARVEIRRERSRPGQTRWPLPRHNNIDVRLRRGCVVERPLQCLKRSRRSVNAHDHTRGA